jgi:hypothetical protein
LARCRLRDVKASTGRQRDRVFLELVQAIIAADLARVSRLTVASPDAARPGAEKAAFGWR